MPVSFSLQFPFHCQFINTLPTEMITIILNILNILFFFVLQETTRMYPCPKCGKTFRQKGNMRTHLYSHTKERTFKCQVCAVWFICMFVMHVSAYTDLSTTDFLTELAWLILFCLTWANIFSSLLFSYKISLHITPAVKLFFSQPLLVLFCFFMLALFYFLCNPSFSLVFVCCPHLPSLFNWFDNEICPWLDALLSDLHLKVPVYCCALSRKTVPEEPYASLLETNFNFLCESATEKDSYVILYRIVLKHSSIQIS